MVGDMGTTEFSGTAEGNTAKFDLEIDAMGQKIALSCELTVDGDSIKGTMTSPMGGMDFSGERES